MLIGYNTNVSFKGKMYHVQTEDAGPAKKYILTQLYHQGAILHSMKKSYEDLAESPDCKEQLRELMKHQHKEMIRYLVKGGKPAEEVPPATKTVVVGSPQGKKEKPAAAEEKKEDRKEEKKALPRSLDEILLDYISKKR